jgi:hypothetical protein
MYIKTDSRMHGSVVQGVDTNLARYGGKVDIRLPRSYLVARGSGNNFYSDFLIAKLPGSEHYRLKPATINAVVALPNIAIQ